MGILWAVVGEFLGNHGDEPVIKVDCVVEMKGIQGDGVIDCFFEDDLRRLRVYISQTSD